MNIEVVVERLDARRVSPKRHMAKCPAHSDRVASLSISHGRGGRVLLHCFAGCSLTSILNATGLSLRDLFDSPPPTKAQQDALEMRRAEQAAIRRTDSRTDLGYAFALRDGYRERASAMKRVAGKVAAMPDNDPSLEIMTRLLQDHIAEARSFDRAIMADPEDHLPMERPVPRAPQHSRAK